MLALLRRCLTLFLGLSLTAVGLAAVAGPALGAPSSTMHPTPSSGAAGVAHLCGPTNFYDCTTGGYTGSEPWGYYTRYGSVDGAGRRHNCTTYAAFKVAANGAVKPGWYDDANGWDTKAWAAGTPVDQTPAVGAVAQWNINTGHVAYVEAVGPGYIEVTDDNYGWNMTNRWRISTSSAAWPDNFIHFHDVPVNPPSPSDTDGDGTPDSADRCPSVSGPAANNGCPWPYSNQLLHNGSFESGIGGWGGMNQAGSVNIASYTNVDRSHDGTGYGEMNTAMGGASVGQNISTAVIAGESYSFSIWLRAAPGVGSYSGNLRLWGLGVSDNEGSDSPFTVGEQWTLVTAPLDAHGNHDQLRAEIYLFSGGNLNADTAQVVRVGLRAASFEPGSPGGWNALNEAGSVNFAGYEDVNRAHDGQGFGEMNSSGTNGSVGQDIPMRVHPGESYAFSIWLRAAPGSSSYTGNLKLWGLGQTANEGFGTPFTVGSSWTLVTAPLDVKGDHDLLRAEIYMNSAGNLDADGAQVVKTGLSSASFESGFAGWHQQSQSGSVNLASYTDRNRSHDGSGFGEMNSAVDGGSVGQDVYVAVAAGDSYAFSVWLRAAPDVESFSGVVRLWGLGLSANEGSDTHFTVGSQWTLVTSPLDAQSPHNQLRAEIYLYSRGNLDADGATLVVGGARSNTVDLAVGQSPSSAAVVGTPWSTSMNATGGVAPYTWSVSSGNLPAGLSLGADGAIRGTPTTAGSSTAVIAVTDMSVPPATATRAVTIDVADPLRVAVGSLPAGVMSTSYSTTLTALGANGATSWSVVSGALPGGLRLTRAGVLSGTPSVAGTFRFVVQVADSASPVHTATQSLTIRVAAIAVATPSVASGAVGKAYAAALSAQGGVGTKTWVVSSGALPAGVSLSSTGRLSGTPSAAGTFRFVVTVTDGASPVNTAPPSMQLVVAPIAVRTTTLKTATTGVAYSQALAAWGGTAPLRWSVTSGALPPGMTLSRAGALSGTSTTAGSYPFTVRVVDANGKSASAPLTVVVQ